MLNKRFALAALLLSVLMTGILPHHAAAKPDTLSVGVALVGPATDKGWSQAHKEGIDYLQSKVADVTVDIVDKLNPTDSPKLSIDDLVAKWVSEGKTLIITTSDSFQDATRVLARKYPNVTFVNISGDDVLKGIAPGNLGNLMGRIEYPQMIGGCAAALKTKTGYVGYLGPLVNNETRRIAVASYLGASYCWQHIRNRDIKDLKFDVKWIGFWFNIEGVTQDPTIVVQDFLKSGADIVISGIDTPEALVEVKKYNDAGHTAYVQPYDYHDACMTAPNVCLGVPYYNWGPSYVDLVQKVRAKTWKSAWLWLPPYWDNINDIDRSNVGYKYGDVLTNDDRQTLNDFTAQLGSKKIDLLAGPIYLQNDTIYIPDGQTATDKQLWNMPALLRGMIGDSADSTN